MKAAYQNLMNEGGEGYNPYNQNETAPMDRAEKMDRLLSIMAATSTQDNQYEHLRREYNALYEQEWDMETTKARRADWNAEMVAAKKAGRKVSLPEIENKMGFTLASLKEAVAHHKL